MLGLIEIAVNQEFIIVNFSRNVREQLPRKKPNVVAYFFILFLQGYPFMESLTENRLLLYSLLVSGFSVVALVSGFIPDVARQFEIVEFPPDVSYTLPLFLGDHKWPIFFFV